MDYEKLLTAFASKKILVIGDVMLDSYCFGKVERISPEAPVPVVSVQKHDNRLGGAANVALNLSSLGASVCLCGIVGKDQAGKQLAEALKQNKIDDTSLFKSDIRPTTVKIRIIGNNIQLLRVDEEVCENIDKQEEKLFIDFCTKTIENGEIDAVIIEDYDKGVITPNVIQAVVKSSSSKGIPVTVDPKKRNFKYYKGVTLFKPNLKELREGLKLENLSSKSANLVSVIEDFRKEIGADMIMTTLSEDGILLKTEKEDIRLPAQVRNIADVSGAGDTVISVATLCLSCGLEPREIAYISNMAGGIVCEYVGVVPIDKEMLIRELNFKKSL